jgi:SAM-dependent methyltransferase
VIKTGKPISKVLLSRTLSWKKNIQEKNAIVCKEMLIPENHIEINRCLLCGNETFPKLTIEAVPYGMCNSCNHLQASKRPVARFLSDLYGSNDDVTSTQNLAYVDISKQDLELRVDEIARPKVKFVSENISFSQSDLWIDIGSGTGDILISARDEGFEILGIEVSPTEISIAEERKVPTLEMFYDGTTEIPSISTAKVVSIFNVLEHTLDPYFFLKSIASQMSKESFLVIEVPRLNSATSVIQYTNPPVHYRHIYPPEHLNIFSDKSIEVLLEKLSMVIVSKWLFGSDAIEIFGYVTALLQPNVNGDMCKFEEAINLLQMNLDEAGLSDVMLLVAKKS